MSKKEESGNNKSIFLFHIYSQMKSLKISLFLFLISEFVTYESIASSSSLATSYSKDSMIFVKANALYNKDFYWTLKDGEWGILNADKKEIAPCVYDIPYVEGEYYSRSNGEGCEFQVTNPVIMLKDSFAYLVDLEEGVISPNSTEFLRKIGSHFVFRSANKKYGILDSHGQIVIPSISETCIYPMFDSLLLLSYEGNYCIHNYKNQVIISPDKFTEQDYRNAINYFIMKGAFNNVHRFEFDTINIMQKDFIPSLIFFDEHYLEHQFEGLKNMLGGFMDSYVDDCCIEGCFRYLNSYMDDSIDWYQVDLDCGENLHTNSDNPYYSIKGLGNGIIEYCNMDLEASGTQVYFDMSYFTYCKITANKVDTLTLKDFFPEYKEALKTINIYFESLMGNEEEIINSIDSSDRIITENTNFYLTNHNIIFLIPYENQERMPLRLEDQLEFEVPYNILEIHIPNGGIIRQIQEYNPPDNE